MEVEFSVPPPFFQSTLEMTTIQELQLKGISKFIKRVFYSHRDSECFDLMEWGSVLSIIILE